MMSTTRLRVAVMVTVLSLLPSIAAARIHDAVTAATAREIARLPEGVKRSGGVPSTIMGAGRPGAVAPLVTAGEDVVIGQSFTLQSRILAQPVRLDIALPPGYENSRNRYPVLFAFQNTLTAVSGVVGAMSRAAAAPEMIVVVAAVPGEMFGLNPVNHRGTEDTERAPSLEGGPASVRGRQVLEFLRRELEPYIDATYRTVPYRIVLGHSASALFGIWALVSAPDAIQAVLAAGPMFAEYDYARVTGMIESAMASRPARSQFLFFTQGNQPELARDLSAFQEMLRARKPAGLTWEFDAEPMSNHNSLAIRTLHDGLWRLYADWSMLPEPVASGGGPAIHAHMTALAERFGYDIGLSPLADNYVRARWTAEGKYDAVIALARFGCEEWPDDHWRRQQLALACERAARWTEAVAAWESAIAVAKAKARETERQAILSRYELRLAEARRKAADAVPE